MGFFSTIVKPFTAPFKPKETICNIGDRYKNHTILGKMISGKKSFGEAVKETLSEKTVIGRMTTKDENIFTAVHHSICVNDVASASIFGDPDKEKTVK